MSIVGSVLTAPVLGPIQGLLWLARKIQEHANAELYDQDKIRGELAELELALDLKKIDLVEFEAREEILLQRLREIREAMNG